MFALCIFVLMIACFLCKSAKKKKPDGDAVSQGEFDRRWRLNVYIREDASAAPPSEENVYSEPSLYSIIPDDVY